MTNREKATYDLIVSNSKNGYLTSKKEIVDNYPFDPEVRKDGYEWNDLPTSHDNCSAVWHDVNAINHSGQDEIIISENGFYWVGTEQETKQYIRNYFRKQCRPSLKRYWNLMRKMKLNNVMDVFNETVHEVCVEGK